MGGAAVGVYEAVGFGVGVNVDVGIGVSLGSGARTRMEALVENPRLSEATIQCCPGAAHAAGTSTDSSNVPSALTPKGPASRYPLPGASQARTTSGWLPGHWLPLTVMVTSWPAITRLGSRLM